MVFIEAIQRGFNSQERRNDSMKRILGLLFFVLLLLCFFYTANNSFAKLDDPFATIWSFVRDVNHRNIAGDASQGFSHDSGITSSARNVHSETQAAGDIDAFGGKGGNNPGDYIDPSSSLGILSDSGANSWTTQDTSSDPSSSSSGTAPLALASNRGTNQGDYIDPSSSL